MLKALALHIIALNKISEANASFIEIVISDNGIGFDSEYNTIIFDTFTRLNSKNKYDGTGLGLSLAKKIVNRHHGTIDANGRMGKALPVTVRLLIKQPTYL